MIPLLDASEVRTQRHPDLVQVEIKAWNKMSRFRVGQPFSIMSQNLLEAENCHLKKLFFG
jgi:hypothetical protein